MGVIAQSCYSSSSPVTCVYLPHVGWHFLAGSQEQGWVVWLFVRKGPQLRGL